MTEAQPRHGQQPTIRTRMSIRHNETAALERHATSRERRQGERRRRVLRALVVGSFYPRRRRPRRDGEQALAAVDWHHPQWLAIAVLIVLFSCADALLTVALLQHEGAYEMNPLMRPLIGSGLAFVLVKVGVTAGGVILLTLLAGMRTVGRLRAGLLLYALLAAYGALLIYEVSLVDRLL
jgi:hypothetical protein